MSWDRRIKQTTLLYPSMCDEQKKSKIFFINFSSTKRNETKKYERSLPIEINNRARWVKGGGRRFFSQIEPTVTGLCRTLPCQYHGWGMLGRAGGFQYMREYNAESPKQDSKRFNSQGTTTNVACAQLCSYYYVARSI